MDKDTLIFLLKGGHMDMTTRIEKGIWPHKPITIKDCVDSIVTTLENDKVFPYAWIERKDGELIDDIDVLEKLNNGKYRYRYRTANPVDLYKISSSGERIFKDAVSAGRYYVHNILRLPGDLDGWQIVN